MPEISNYTIYHLHSQLSNGVTNIDSVTKYEDYIEAAKNCGMKAMAFSEHGSVFEWWHKKCAIENAGMKYIHAAEVYLTETIEEKIRDNYHCVLVAKNYDGFLELNRLISKSFNRKDGHFYYVPRITFSELYNTSDNIIITTACVGGVFGKGDADVQDNFIKFLMKNRDRCFLEIGHHKDAKQVEYNKKMADLGERYCIRLIAGTDTHVLNETHEKGRLILQASKNIRFDGEEKWDLKFKTFEELVESYREQNSLPENIFISAIENTNVLAEMVSPFELDRNTKYPHIYNDPEQTFYNKILNAVEKHPYALKNHTKERLLKRIDDEFSVYKATNSIDFMLLQTHLREWERENGIQCGYGRGSVSGSMIAYLLGITQMDSMRFDLNFFRFMSPDRVTNADIDTDYSGTDRDKVKYFLLHDKMNIPSIKSAEIITFNTIATKGAVRDVCRALYKDSATVNYMQLSSEICDNVESNEEDMRKKYPQVFEYVDIINGTIVSIGTHPSGVLISDLPIEQTIGLCSISTSDYPVSMINMKELDDLMYVKMDILGLDNIAIINETCRLLGIERLTPDNVDQNDMNVWKSIRDDTTLIFQWESGGAQQYIRKFMSDKTIEIASKKIPDFSMMKWMAFGNGLIRPACASFRDQVASGEFYDNGFKELNDFLAPEAGRVAMQETIMMFLVKFCGYSHSESDTVRRAIAKKKGTDKLLPEIERRFVEYVSNNYEKTRSDAEKIIKPFIQIILDASAYSFSWNHAEPYSEIGYVCGYLRYYHPYEFLTAALNIFSDNQDKTADIIKYANRIGINITMPKFGISRSSYTFNKERRIIAKGLSSVKYMNTAIADELFELSKNKKYNFFVDLLYDISKSTSVNTRQLDIMIKLDFFSDFGNQRELLRINDLFQGMFKCGNAKKIKRSEIDGTMLEKVVNRYAVGVTKSNDVAKSYTLLDVSGMMREAEKIVMSQELPDLDDIIKVKNFYDIEGYIGYTSGKEEDRPKLCILDIYPLKRKRDGVQFGYSFVTKSIGSGKEARFTVFASTFFDHPVKKHDIILCKKYNYENGYFTLLDYDQIF